MKLLRRIGVSIGALLFVACCGAVLLMGRPVFGWQVLSVPTGSMKPTFSPGSLVLVHRVSNSSLKVGDVITYTNPKTMKGTITHRITQTTLINRIPVYVTKGDANKSEDMLPVIGSLVQGKMITHVPYIGQGLMWGKTWLAIALLIYIPATLLMFTEVRRMAAYLKSQMPYYLYPIKKQPHTSIRRVATAGAVSFVVLLVGAAFAPTVLALMQSNTVALTNNRLSVRRVPTPSSSCRVNNHTVVKVKNNNPQTAQSGNASSSGNTTGGSANSGDASNNSSTDININITNGGC